MLQKVNKTRMKVASRADISPFMVMEALREAHKVEAAGDDVIHWSLGQPCATPPQQVLDQLAERVKTDGLGYTDSRGLPALRDRISHYYEERYGLEVSRQRIFVTVGSSSAFFMSLLAAFDAGDKVALAVPHYPAYPNIMRTLGIEPVFVRADKESNFQPTVDMLKALPEKPDGLIIASPSNPTGTVIGPAVYGEIVDYCEANHIRILSDEIYHHVTYGEAETKTVLAMSDNMIATNSFSKYFLLPGWRLGWAVVPEDMQRVFESLVQNYFISPPAASQYAALDVFDHLNVLDGVVEGYRENRDYLLKELPEIGLSDLCAAEGAFYIYANVSTFTDDSREFCRKMLHEAYVSAIPGCDFDGKQGHHYIRISYAGSFDEIKEGCARLAQWLS